MNDPSDAGGQTTQYNLDPDHSAAEPTDLRPPIRYCETGVLGEGGMGRVSLVDDAVVRRQVALKRVRPDKQDQRAMAARFVEEARLQGRLQHPNILPVYDIGVDDEDQPYFTMRPIEGQSLAEALGEVDATARRREFLSGLSQVALAVDYAHRNDVVHCDLKPRNIVLGTFGEVYVVDWGAAHDLRLSLRERASILSGSPNYMAPEQTDGRTHLIAATTDVFALGAIVFEVVRGHSLAESVRSASAGADVFGDLPEPLGVLCQRATSTDPDHRYPSMREFHDVLQGFLDGELDGERKASESRRLASDAARSAELLSSSDNELEERTHAVQAAGRALALDPSNPVAFEVFLDVLDTPMQEEPSEVVDMAADAQLERIRRLGKTAVFAYCGQLLHSPLFLAADVREPGYLYAFYASMAVATVVALWTHLRPSEAKVALCLAVSSLGAASLTGLLGPLFVMPMVVIVNAATFGVMFSGRKTALPTLAGVLSLSAPYVGSKLGWLPDVYAFGGDSLVIQAGAFALDAGAEMILFAVNLVTLAFGSIVIAVLSLRVRSVERRLFAQTWHLRRLLPGSATLQQEARSPDRSRREHGDQAARAHGDQH